MAGDLVVNVGDEVTWSGANTWYEVYKVSGNLVFARDSFGDKVMLDVRFEMSVRRKGDALWPEK